MTIVQDVDHRSRHEPCGLRAHAGDERRRDAHEVRIRDRHGFVKAREPCSGASQLVVIHEWQREKLATDEPHCGERAVEGMWEARHLVPLHDAAAVDLHERVRRRRVAHAAEDAPARVHLRDDGMEPPVSIHVEEAPVAAG